MGGTSTTDLIRSWRQMQREMGRMGRPLPGQPEERYPAFYELQDKLRRCEQELRAAGIEPGAEPIAPNLPDPKPGEPLDAYLARLQAIVGAYLDELAGWLS